MVDYNAIHNIYNEGYYAYNSSILSNIGDYIPFYNLLSHYERLYTGRLYQSSMDQDTSLQDTTHQDYSATYQDKYGDCNGNYARLQSKFYNTAMENSHVLLMFSSCSSFRINLIEILHNVERIDCNENSRYL